MTRIKELLSFEKKVNKTYSCWLWTASTIQTCGYGQFFMNGKKITAHRASWVIHNGYIPRGKCILHKCDNKICVNPEHLFLGTKKQNSQDALAKGRWPTGAKNSMSKISDAQAAEIRASYIPYKVHSRILAKKYGISNSCILDIIHGKSYKNAKNTAAN